MNIQHSSRTDAWGTPWKILEMARDVLGGIDFDPASEECFNYAVKATSILTKEDNGLTACWPPDVSVWLNPPGGKTKNKSNTALFWHRLMQFRNDGWLKHAIFMAFSLEALQTTQDGRRQSIAEFPFCVPRRRIAFITPEGKPGPAPSHSNAIVYVPGQVDNTAKFVEVFGSLGAVIVPERR